MKHIPAGEFKPPASAVHWTDVQARERPGRGLRSAVFRLVEACCSCRGQNENRLRIYGRCNFVLQEDIESPAVSAESNGRSLRETNIAVGVQGFRSPETGSRQGKK